MLPDRDQPPDYLPPDARAWWTALVDELAGRGTLARVARHRLAIYCQLFAQYHRVTSFINNEEEGQIAVIRNEKGEVKDQIITPEARQQEKLVKLLKAFDKEFGLLEEIKEKDPLEALRQKLSARLAGGAQAN
jgi:P27 family predicted phage terminase small subunit